MAYVPFKSSAADLHVEVTSADKTLEMTCSWIAFGLTVAVAAIAAVAVDMKLNAPAPYGLPTPQSLHHQAVAATIDCTWTCLD